MELLENVSLKPYNTFGIDVAARRFAILDSYRDIAFLLKRLVREPEPLLILGGGSNLLFTGDFRGTVAKIRTKGIRVIKEDDEKVWVTAKAGEEWDPFVQFCVGQGWGGLENLSLIPGTVGAAPIQNIGAYGVEVKDVLSGIGVIERDTLSIRQLVPADCDFGYRESIFKTVLKERFVIRNVTFCLAKKPLLRLDYGNIREELRSMQVSDPTVADVREAVIRIRRRKLPDPAVTGNAGSFFKNPVISGSQFRLIRKLHPAMPSFPSGNQVKVPAAWLIEQCGWKGFRKGDAGVHPGQPLVLVNYGHATGREILSLSENIRSSVKERFGIELCTEVNVIGG